MDRRQKEKEWRVGTVTHILYKMEIYLLDIDQSGEVDINSKLEVEKMLTSLNDEPYNMQS